MEIYDNEIGLMEIIREIEDYMWFMLVISFRFDWSLNTEIAVIVSSC